MLAEKMVCTVQCAMYKKLKRCFKHFLAQLDGPRQCDFSDLATLKRRKHKNY